MSTAIATIPKGMNAEQFWAWANRPENEDRWFELVRGEVIELPPPQKPHGIICMNLARPLDAYVRRRRKGYVTINDAGVILERNPDTVRGPDVAVYEDEDTFEEMPTGYGEVPPVLAVEVLSPDDRADQIIRKVTDYLQNGVSLVWLLDPQAQTVTVYRPDKGPQLLQGKQKLTGEDVLPSFQCRLADFFAVPGGKRKSKPQRKTAPKRRRKS
jgi:Uma2 family endonuclease